jgi:hypothetical protein
MFELNSNMTPIINIKKGTISVNSRISMWVVVWENITQLYPVIE